MPPICACGRPFCIRKVPIFSKLSDEHLHRIMPLIAHKEYQKGELLLREGEKTESVVILNKGRVKAYKITPDGREQILYLFSEGDFFGEQNFLGDSAARYHVEALEPVKTCSFSKTDFEKLLAEHPEISMQIIAELSRRISRMENTFQAMGVRNVDARIAGMLLEYAEKYGEDKPDGVLLHLPVSREGMANALGIARETMSRKLGQLESAKLIETISYKTLRIKNKDALADLAGFSD